MPLILADLMQSSPRDFASRHAHTHTCTRATAVRSFLSLQARLVGIYETSSAAGLQQLALRYTLPQRLVREVGAPETLWMIIR